MPVQTKKLVHEIPSCSRKEAHAECEKPIIPTNVFRWDRSIDVRPNSGGAEPLAQGVAGCFVGRPTLYAKHVYRDASSPSGFGKLSKRMLQPNEDQPRYRGKVVVLTGPENMSSCEGFLLMMKAVPRLSSARREGSVPPSPRR